MPYRKKLIEVSLPLECINEGSKPETENPFLRGHPRAIHNWWARIPLSVARAIIFAQLIDDPGNDLPPEEAKSERDKLLELVSQLATWEATTDERILERARTLIYHQFDGDLPIFWDMFSGRASIPLEAQRLGLPTISSDLNPVSVIIQKALLVYPPLLSNHKQIHPAPENNLLFAMQSHPLEGLMADLRFYGQVVMDKARKKLLNYYPKGPQNKEVFAWLWARSIPCPNPACKAEVPLYKLTTLVKRKDRQISLSPKIDHPQKKIDFGLSSQLNAQPDVTISRSGGRCLVCGEPIQLSYIRSYAIKFGFNYKLLAIVLSGSKGREYIEPIKTHEDLALSIEVDDRMDIDLPKEALGFGVQAYGLVKHSQLYTRRQLLTLGVLSDTVANIYQQVLDESGGDELYAASITTYLSCAVSRMADYHCALATWNSTNENIGHLFQMQTVPMVWDFAEANPLEGPLNFDTAIGWVINSLATLPAYKTPAISYQMDARQSSILFDRPVVVSTDPPYYDNIGYSDLSDFFYVWLRRSLHDIEPDLFSTILSPKDAELIAYSPRHEGSEISAKQFFENGFNDTFVNIKSIAHPNVPITIYYAFKQSDLDTQSKGLVSTGWESMLSGLIEAGFIVTATIPVRTTKTSRARALGSNALASAVVLAVRPRAENAPLASRKEFLYELKNTLPNAVKDLITSNIPPVDLAQASIGPGIAIFSRYKAVLESDGTKLSIRTALALINQALDEYLTEQEGEYDAETRWALAWFEQYGHEQGPYGVAETLSTAKNTSVEGLVRAGGLEARAGKVRLLRRDELNPDWDPTHDKLLTVWEMAQHLIQALDKGGEKAAGALLTKLGAAGETARDLAYRLYTVCERKNWSQEAQAYNMLVVAWPRLKEQAGKSTRQDAML